MVVHVINEIILLRFWVVVQSVLVHTGDTKLSYKGPVFQVCDGTLHLQDISVRSNAWGIWGPFQEQILELMHHEPALNTTERHKKKGDAKYIQPVCFPLLHPCGSSRVLSPLGLNRRDHVY